MPNVLIINCSPVKDGATAEIAKTVCLFAEKENEVMSVCIDDYDIHLCKGCRSCHKTAKCFQNDDVSKLMEHFDRADKIICVSPSYWADVPGQFKVFIDRCTGLVYKVRVERFRRRFFARQGNTTKAHCMCAEEC